MSMGKNGVSPRTSELVEEALKILERPASIREVIDTLQAAGEKAVPSRDTVRKAFWSLWEGGRVELSTKDEKWQPVKGGVPGCGLFALWVPREGAEEHRDTIVEKTELLKRMMRRNGPPAEGQLVEPTAPVETAAQTGHNRLDVHVYFHFVLGK